VTNFDVGELNHGGDKRGRDAVDGEISDKEASDRIACKYEIVTSRRRRNSSDTRFSSSRILLAFLLAVTFVPPVHAEDERNANLRFPMIDSVIGITAHLQAYPSRVRTCSRTRRKPRHPAVSAWSKSHRGPGRGASHSRRDSYKQLGGFRDLSTARQQISLKHGERCKQVSSHVISKVLLKQHRPRIYLNSRPPLFRQTQR